MNNNKNKKDFKTPRKRTFNKAERSNNNKFEVKKTYTSKYNSNKEYSDKKYNKDKPSYKDDSYVRKSSDSKYSKPYKDKKPYNRDEKPYKKSYEKKEPYSSDDNQNRNDGDSKKKLIKASERKEYIGKGKEYSKENKGYEKKFSREDKPLRKTHGKKYGSDEQDNGKKYFSQGEKTIKTFRASKVSEGGPMRLNKYIANAGICSRREADELISSGAVTVNGKVVTEMGVKVLPSDVISYGGQTLKNEKNVYLLLNKPKDFITTSDDPYNRKTVMSLVQKACKERIYPVGRLDRMTTGLLLFTNDGEIAKKLTHPKHGIKKIYHVELDKSLSKSDMMKITEGVELEDGLATVDLITYVGEGADKKSLGMELHSGKNRVVRRIFEHLGYNVVKLDRVYFAGLTKKDLPRGRHRFLTEAEINMLKIIS
jgi:23S rRNA pseudouridine2605 synthase